MRLVLGLLNETDPYGLDPGVGAPVDEYEREAASMASLLVNRGAISAEQANEIWNEGFKERLGDVIGGEKLDRLIVSLNDLDLPTTES